MVEKYIFLVLAFCLILFSYLIYLIIKVKNKNKNKNKEKEIKNHFDEMVKGIDLNLGSESANNDLIEIEEDLLALKELYEKSMIDLETYQEYALKFSNKIKNKE